MFFFLPLLSHITTSINEVYFSFLCIPVVNSLLKGENVGITSRRRAAAAAAAVTGNNNSQASSVVSFKKRGKKPINYNKVTKQYEVFLQKQESGIDGTKTTIYLPRYFHNINYANDLPRSFLIHLFWWP